VGLTSTLSAPYFTGQTRSEQVPHKFDVSLNGRGYMVDLQADADAFSRRSIPLLRNQANTGDQFGEASLNPEELWRRSQDSFDHGAGQTYLDREDSDRRRFRSSKGVDVWTRWALSLLPDTASRRTSTASNLALMPAGDNLYLTDGADLLRTTDLTTWTAITGLPATAPASVTSDGFNVFTAHGGDGVYRTTRGAGDATSYATGTVTLLGYIKGRLMAAAGSSVYNITASGTLPAALFTHPNTDFTWIGFAGGPTLPVIYAAGFSGDKSLVYRTAIKADGTGLDAMIVAGELPDGEIVRSIDSYLGFVLLGTDEGVRFCATDSQGNLQIGALIRTGVPVRCFEGQDRFVWFGWSNYDAASTGLGRMDLTAFPTSGLLAPAYASDLMADGQGAVTTVVSFGRLRLFTVSGLGVFGETSEKVESGTLDSGLITYGLSDPKVAVFVDVRLSDLSGSNSAWLAVDGGEFVQLGTRGGDSDDEAFQAGQIDGESFEVRHELVRSATSATAGPVVTRWTLRSYPKTTRGEIFTVPLLLHETVTDRGDVEVPVDVAVELAELLVLQTSRQLFIYQVGEETHTVLLEDSVFAYSHRTSDGRAWNGTHNVKLKGVG
jgi:hypothetical protein